MRIDELTRGALRRLRAALRPGAIAASDAGAISRTIDLDDPRISLDPFGWYERLRAEGAVVHLPRHDAWIVLTYAAAQRVLSDAQRFSNSPYAFLDPVMLGADPPAHGPVRRIVSRRFNGEMLRRLEGEAAAIANDRIGSAFDIVADYARPISRATAATLIGLEAGALARVDAAEDAVADGREGGFDLLLRTLDAEAPTAEAFHVFRGEGLSDAQARSLVRLLWVASTATTARTIAHCGLRLLSDPHLQEDLRSRPEGIPAFIDEVVRLAPPELLLKREAIRETSLQGVTIPAGGKILISIGAANRDPAVYQEPAQFAAGRAPPSLAFGTGIHACVGGPLSRRIVATALATLLERTSRLAPAEPLDSLPFIHAMVVRAPARLHVLTT